MASGTGHMTKQIRFLNSAWKMESDWYITSLDHIHFCLIPILEGLCHGPNCQWINQWKKWLRSGLIKNESYFVRTRNISCGGKKSIFGACNHFRASPKYHPNFNTKFVTDQYHYFINIFMAAKWSHIQINKILGFFSLIHIPIPT